MKRVKEIISYLILYFAENLYKKRRKFFIIIIAIKKKKLTKKRAISGPDMILK
jgi:hypothetical protein